MPKMLTNLRIDEVSSVDRGAGEGVKIMLMKRKFTAGERRADAKSGAAMPDGSFPIHNAEDLRNARALAGKAKDPAKARAHIAARARALGLSKKRDTTMTIASMFSKVFGGGNDNETVIDKSVEGLAESITSIFEDEQIVDKAAALTETFEQFGDHLKSTLTAGPAVTKTEGSNMDLAILKKALGLADTATEVEVTEGVVKSLANMQGDLNKVNKELQIAKAEFTAAELSHYEKAFPPEEDGEDADGKKKAKKAFREASHADRDAIIKAAEPALPAHIQKVMDDNAAMAKRIADLEAGGNMAALTKQAQELGLPDTEAATLQKAYSGDKAAVDKILGFVKTAQAAAKVGGVFKEFGAAGGTGVDSTPYNELETKAKELQKADPKLTFAKAFAKVYEDPANIEIVKRERGENRPTAA